MGLLFGVLFFVVGAHAWDARVTIDRDSSQIASGDTVEYEVQLFNNEIGGSYTDTGATLEVTFDNTGLEFVSETSSIATLVSTGINSLIWSINSFTPNQQENNFVYEDDFVRFVMRGIMVDNFSTTAEVIPGIGAPAEYDSENNMDSIGIQVINSVIDGECGTAMTSNAAYYSGYDFSEIPELCIEGVPNSPENTENTRQPNSTTSGFVWNCLSSTGGNPDSCTADIRYCGDTIDDPEEACDDGAFGSDACTDICTVTFCGDATTQSTNGQGGTEVCDDGNTDEDDGCLNTCQFSFCGDGIVQSINGVGGIEECDDGANGDDADGCNDLCVVTTNGICGGDHGTSLYDSTPDGSELSSGSSSLCSGSIATGFVYSGTSAHQRERTCLGIEGGSDMGCQATELYCGDSVGGGVEECDDGGNGDGTDGCNDSCELTTNGICGEAIISPIYDFEGDGSELASGSSTLCTGSIVTGFVYDTIGHDWSWTCQGSLNGGADISCGTSELYCGDSVGGGGEECDDGKNGDDTDGCNDVCVLSTNGICGDADLLPVYDIDGDGSELLSGASTLCSGSIATGFVYSGTTAHQWDWTCLGTEGGSDIGCGTTELYCGDSVVGGGEECDDGNSVGDDGCDSVCNWEIPSCTLSITPGTGLAPVSVTASPTFPIWATLVEIDWQDGTIDTSTSHTYVTTGSFLTQMTVANTDNGSLTATCTDLVQVSTECGNGLTEIGEMCDDGLTNGIVCDPSYGGTCSYCSAECRTIQIVGGVCGDSIAHLLDGEQCDDGNTNNMDACPNDCQLAVCGDGVIDGLEACDDGNTTSDDGCSDICASEGPPPSRKGSTRATSKSSGFVASTASVTDEDTAEQEEKENFEISPPTLENNEKSELGEKIQDKDSEGVKEHNAPIDIFGFIRSRNFSIMQVIKKRNIYIAQMKLLQDVLKERNFPIKEHAAPSVNVGYTAAKPTILLDKKSLIQENISKKTLSSKAELKAALLQYLILK